MLDLAAPRPPYQQCRHHVAAQPARWGRESGQTRGGDPHQLSRADRPFGETAAAVEGEQYRRRRHGLFRIRARPGRSGTDLLGEQGGTALVHQELSADRRERRSACPGGVAAAVGYSCNIRDLRKEAVGRRRGTAHARGARQAPRRDSTWTGAHAADAAPLAARHGRKNCCAELIPLRTAETRLPTISPALAISNHGVTARDALPMRYGVIEPASANSGPRLSGCRGEYPSKSSRYGQPLSLVP